MSSKECPVAPCCGNSAEQLAGVGALIVSSHQSFLSIQELTTSARTVKLGGMRSFPMETIEPGEKPCEALQRLFEEEVLVPEKGQLRFKANTCEVQIREGLWVGVYLYEVEEEVPIEVGSAAHEVANPTWVSLDSVLRSPVGNLNFRPGVRETVTDFSLFGNANGPRIYETCEDTPFIQRELAKRQII